MNESAKTVQPKKERKGLKTLLRVAAFFVVLCFALRGASLLLMDNNVFAGRNVGGFYKLEENSLDAVYIGSSRVYAFWTPLFAFRDHGITVFNLSTAAQPIDAARFLVEEARKTQPDAVMIINLEAFQNDWYASLHRITDRLRLSGTKFDFINTFSKRHGIRFLDRIEYFLPLTRYHARWQELTEEDFSVDTGEYMSSSSYATFLYSHTDVTAEYPAPVEASTPIGKDARAVLDELIDYLIENDIPALFTLAPQAGVTEEELKERNGLRDHVRSRGIAVLDLQNSLAEMGIDLSADYVNTRHMNVHGSEKFTEYVARYLIDTYGFTDKRTDPAYAGWQTALEKYETLIASEGNVSADTEQPDESN